MTRIIDGDGTLHLPCCKLNFSSKGFIFTSKSDNVIGLCEKSLVGWSLITFFKLTPHKPQYDDSSINHNLNPTSTVLKQFFFKIMFTSFKWTNQQDMVYIQMSLWHSKRSIIFNIFFSSIFVLAVKMLVSTRALSTPTCTYRACPTKK